ncbi:MAG: hypothetical protein QXN71_01625 [Candidatus Aenigmatarchaeota archaeon]
MRKTKIIICPFCDQEAVVKLNQTLIKCSNCGEAFEIEEESYTDDFWHNPRTSHTF